MVYPWWARVETLFPANLVEPQAESLRWPNLRCVTFAGIAGKSSSERQEATYTDRRSDVPVWAWILIIVLLVLLLSGGIYVRR